jgi:hypothetical protein
LNLIYPNVGVEVLLRLVARGLPDEVRWQALVEFEGRTPDYQDEFKCIFDEKISA